MGNYQPNSSWKQVVINILLGDEGALRIHVYGPVDVKSLDELLQDETLMGIINSIEISRGISEEQKAIYDKVLAGQDGWIAANQYIDLDNDGTYEFWFVAKNEYGERYSFFYTIVNGEAKCLLSEYLSEGSMGGSIIDVRFDNETKRRIVLTEGSSKIYGGWTAYKTYYNYAEGEVTKLFNTLHINAIQELIEEDKENNHFDPDKIFYEDSEPRYAYGMARLYIEAYFINDAQTTIEEFDGVEERFVNPRFEFLYNTMLDEVG
jgi:hypothetical protein